MILIIYRSQVCREIVLPNADNTDYRIFIDSKEFKLKKSFYLSLEVIAHKWSITNENGEYKIVKNQTEFEKTIENTTKVQYVRNVLNEYFFNSEISLQIKEYKLVSDFNKFYDKLYWISNSMVFILDNPGELDSCEVNQQCSCYLNELKPLIKEDNLRKL